MPVNSNSTNIFTSLIHNRPNELNSNLISSDNMVLLDNSNFEQQPSENNGISSSEVSFNETQRNQHSSSNDQINCPPVTLVASTLEPFPDYLIQNHANLIESNLNIISTSDPSNSLNNLINSPDSFDSNPISSFTSVSQNISTCNNPVISSISSSITKSTSRISSFCQDLSNNQNQNEIYSSSSNDSTNSITSSSSNDSTNSITSSSSNDSTNSITSSSSNDLTNSIVSSSNDLTNSESLIHISNCSINTSSLQHTSSIDYSLSASDSNTDRELSFPSSISIPNFSEDSFFSSTQAPSTLSQRSFLIDEEAIQNSSEMNASSHISPIETEISSSLFLKSTSLIDPPNSFEPIIPTPFSLPQSLSQVNSDLSRFPISLSQVNSDLNNLKQSTNNAILSSQNRSKNLNNSSLNSQKESVPLSLNQSIIPDDPKQSISSFKSKLISYNVDDSKQSISSSSLFKSYDDSEISSSTVNQNPVYLNYNEMPSTNFVKNSNSPSPSSPAFLDTEISSSAIQDTRFVSKTSLTSLEPNNNISFSEINNIFSSIQTVANNAVSSIEPEDIIMTPFIETETNNRNSSDESTNKISSNDEVNNKFSSDENNNMMISFHQANNKTASDEANNKTASDEANNKKVSDEANNKTASDEANNKTASDEANNKTTSDEANNKTTSDEGNNKTATDEANNKTASDERTNRISFNEVNNRISLNEVNNRISSDEVNNRISSDEANNRISSDEANYSILSSEANNRFSSDEANNRILSDEANNRILSSEANNRILSSEANNNICVVASNNSTRFSVEESFSRTHNISSSNINNSDSSTSVSHDLQASSSTENIEVPSSSSSSSSPPSFSEENNNNTSPREPVSVSNSVFNNSNSSSSSASAYQFFVRFRVPSAWLNLNTNFSISLPIFYLLYQALRNSLKTLIFFIFLIFSLFIQYSLRCIRSLSFRLHLLFPFINFTPFSSTWKKLLFFIFSFDLFLLLLRIYLGHPILKFIEQVSDPIVNSHMHSKEIGDPFISFSLFQFIILFIRILISISCNIFPILLSLILTPMLVINRRNPNHHILN